MGFDRHGLALSEAGLLDGKTIQQNACNCDVINGRMHEYVGGRTAGSLGGSGYGDQSGTSGSAGGESGVEMAGAPHAIRSDVENRSIAGNVSERGRDIAAGTVGCRGGEADKVTGLDRSGAPG